MTVLYTGTMMICNLRLLTLFFKELMKQIFTIYCTEVVWLTLAKSASELNPKPYTVLARGSDHWPNFCEVFVNAMLGVMVLLMMACKTQIIINKLILSTSLKKKKHLKYRNLHYVTVFGAVYVHCWWWINFGYVCGFVLKHQY